MSIESKIEELTGEVANLTNAIHALIEVQGGDTSSDSSDSSDAGVEAQSKPSGGSKKKTGKKKSGKKKASSKGSGSNDESSNGDEGSDDEPEITLKDVQQKLIAVGRVHHRPGIEEVLAQFNASNAKELDPGQYADVIAAADAKLKE